MAKSSYGDLGTFLMIAVGELTDGKAGIQLDEWEVDVHQHPWLLKCVCQIGKFPHFNLF